MNLSLNDLLSVVPIVLGVWLVILTFWVIFITILLIRTQDVLARVQVRLDNLEDPPEADFLEHFNVTDEDDEASRIALRYADKRRRARFEEEET